MISQIDWITLDGEIPIFQDLLFHNKFDKSVYILHFLLRINATNCETISHARACPDTVRDAIYTAKLGRQMDHIIAVLYNNQGLVVVRDMHTVNSSHVLGDTSLCVIVNELFICRIRLEVDVCDLISSLIAPICDHAGSNDLLSDSLLELLIIISCIFLERFDFIKAGNGGHKAEECVHSDCNTSLTHENRSLVTFEHL